MLGRLLAHLGDPVWSQFEGIHKLILFLCDESLSGFAFYFQKIAGVWLTAHQLLQNGHSISRWISFCVCRHWKPTGQVLGLCLACVKSCDQQWNHRVELFCPSSSFSLRQWCSCLWLSVPTCGLGNQAEQHMNFNKCCPSFMHSPTCLSQFCFWLQQLMCRGGVKPGAGRIWGVIEHCRHSSGRQPCQAENKIQFFCYEVPGQ